MFIEHSVNFCALLSTLIFKKLRKHVDQKNTFCKCTVQTFVFCTETCLSQTVVSGFLFETGG